MEGCESGYYAKLILKFNGRVTFADLAKMVQAEGVEVRSNTLNRWISQRAVPKKNLRDHTLAIVEKLYPILQLMEETVDRMEYLQEIRDLDG